MARRTGCALQRTTEQKDNAAEHSLLSAAQLRPLSAPRRMNSGSCHGVGA